MIGLLVVLAVWLGLSLVIGRAMAGPRARRRQIARMDAAARRGPYRGYGR